MSKTFVIDRSKWRCGGGFGPTTHGNGLTQLLNRFGFMCCLGQVSLQLGCKPEQINEVSRPDMVWNEYRHPLFGVLVDEFSAASTVFSSMAMNINDDESLDDATRESKLTALFAEHGYTLTFTGEYTETGS